MYKSKLDGIEGLGPKLRLKLLRKYKSISNISKQSIDELNTVLPLKVAQRLYNKLREKNDDQDSEWFYIDCDIDSGMYLLSKIFYRIFDFTS